MNGRLYVNDLLFVPIMDQECSKPVQNNSAV